MILALDLSTTCTGWALFSEESRKLLAFGHFKPKVPGLAKMTYPKQQLEKMRNLSDQIVAHLAHYPDVKLIVIEEINRGTSRLTQKTLDGLHFILVDRLGAHIDLVRYRDSDGKDGWRKVLGFVLTEEDKKLNAERKRLNKRRKKGERGKLPIINKKHLACRFVNATYQLQLDCDEREADGDMADAIGLGHVAAHKL